jgi:hypothetical protein
MSFKQYANYEYLTDQLLHKSKGGFNIKIIQVSSIQSMKGNQVIN